MWLKISEKTLDQIIEDQIKDAELYRDLMDKTTKEKEYYNGILVGKLETVGLLLSIKKSMLLCTENEDE